ncbi:MAG: tyrosine--tRNA ligase [Gemmatimonadetes bacterium]|nr:tyrosine--tRNA ligase [Gemmatimonadota bacterium]
MDILTDLNYRGLVFQVTEGLEDRLQKGPITLYSGFDPTAESLTIGNLIPALVLRRFQLAGHRPIGLVGGGTGLIGDPSGRDEERKLNTADVVEAWTAGMRSQLERFLDFNGANPARIVSNHDWLFELRAIDLLRDVGKHFPLSYMLAKESVSARMEGGISYTEFSYMVLQAYDFLELRRSYDCELQIGGSDQWGNITAGTELIRRETGKTAFGLTNALLERSDGKKFSKSEGSAIWLDEKLTSPYQFYQWFVNVPDADAVSFLKIFTFLSHEDIDELARGVERAPEKREAQRVLAEETTRIVHGDEATQRATNISEALFSGDLKRLSEREVEEGFSDVPSHTLQGESDVGLIDLLVDGKLSQSKRQAREDVNNGAIYINGERVTAVETELTPGDALCGKFLVMRRGKRNYFLVRWDR